MATTGHITAVSFDGDGTLWDFEKVMRHSLGYALGELERLDPPAAAALSIERMIEIRDAVAVELQDCTTNLEEIRLGAFRRALAVVGRPNDELAAVLNSVYLKHRLEDVELFEDVLPTFEELRTGYAIGLLSNGNTYPKCVGLEGFFSFVAFSQDHGVAKPDRRLFEIALKEAGCPQCEMLHVGDSLETDVAGAHNAGIRSVWVNRKNAQRAGGAAPDYEISSLSQLPGILRGLECAAGDGFVSRG